MLCDGIKFAEFAVSARDEELKKFSYAPHLDSKGDKSIMKYCLQPRMSPSIRQF